MSDIVARLRDWRSVHLARLHLLMEEAADEMERLSRTGTIDAKTDEAATECHDQGVKCPERECLTDEEREAVETAVGFCECTTSPLPTSSQIATIRGLLERLG